eukprot:9787-Heterococcus_DN1.PRE.2
MMKRALSVAACLFACPAHCFVVPALQRNTACRTAQCAMSACGDAQQAKLGQSVSSVAAALLIGSSILTSSSLPAQASSSIPASTVYVSEADQIDTVLAELAAADSSESILQAMVRINEISESDDGTLEDPMTRETVVKALSQSKRDGASKGQWRDDLDFAYGVLRRRLDPYSTFALRPYLQIAPYLGGLYYLIAFFVQQKFPAVFPTAYFSL